MEDLRRIIDQHEKTIQNILYHKKIDYEKRLLVWKHNCSEWTRQGKEGVPYPKPQLYPEYLVRQNNKIHFRAEVLEHIYKKIEKKLASI